MHKLLQGLALAALILFLPIDYSSAQIVINEICPSNVSIVGNGSGEFDDWIELCNTGGSAFNLNGYKLTDDIGQPDKFIFPNVNIAVGQKLVVFASEKQHIPVNHYELVVDGSGLFSYSAGYSSIDTNWRNISFNAQSWAQGNGGIGFTDGDDATEIPNTGSLMMRREFNISDTSAIMNAILMMDYDDGFVAYLNGVEIAHSNMPSFSCRPEWNTLALVTHEAQLYLGNKPDSIFISGNTLRSIIREGTNVLAVEVHDYSPNPGDMSAKPFLFFGLQNSTVYYSTPLPSWFSNLPDFFQTGFKLKSAGESIYLMNPSGNVVDQQLYWLLQKDHSYGRIPDGSSNWCYINTPSPGFSNNSCTCYSGYSNAVSFSPDGGYFSVAQTVSMSAPQGTIHYTLNGDEPTVNSPVYFAPVTISQTQVLRARVFENGILPGNISSKTYIINEDSHLPLLSISTDSLNLWDFNNGIFAIGPNADSIPPYFGANFWQSWIKTASFEYFDKGHSRKLSFDADIQVYGNYSRYKPQKSLEIKLRDYYGFGEITFPIIPDKPYIRNYDRLIIRNAGTDNNRVHFRDALMQRIMKYTSADYVAAEPVKVLLNGKQWGVYLLSEKHDNNWIQNNYNLEEDEFDLIEEIGNTFVTHVGSDEEFENLYDYIVHSNPTDSSYMTEIGKLLDTKNFTDYFIAETYVNNGDWIGEWTNNIKIWKNHKDGGKWRYIMIDLDYGFGLHGDITDNRIGLARNPIEISHTSDMFDAMLNNTTFRTYFINRYADLMNTIYLPDNVDKVMHGFKDSMAFDMVDHFAKWGGDTNSWNHEISNMMNWVSQRPQIVRDQIRSEFNLPNEVLLTVDAVPAGSGRIQISTLVPSSLPWSGIYYNGNPVTITAIPNPGYTFDHWSSAIISNDTRKVTTYNFTSSDNIIAYFTGSPATPELTVSEFNYHSADEYKSDDWIELYNYGTFDLDLSQWILSRGDDHTKFVFPVGTVIPANNYLVVPEDESQFRALYPHVTNIAGKLTFSISNGGDNIAIKDYMGVNYLDFTYDDNAPWPIEADGFGYTCELLSPTGDLNNGVNWFPGCFGGSPGRAYSPVLSTLIDIIGDNFYCLGTSTTLTTTPVSQYQYRWKMNGNDISGMTADSLVVAQQGIYNLEVSLNNCSATSPDLLVLEKTKSNDPVAIPGSRCVAGEVELNATAEDDIYWYETPGGLRIGEGKTFLTKFLDDDKTYYINAGAYCPSNTVAITAEITNGDCNDMMIYPNPSTHAPLVIHQDQLSEGDALLIISDMKGSVVYNSQIQITSTGNSVPLSVYLRNGVYNVSLYQGDIFFNSKLVMFN
jgi:hypothetical protein